MPLQTLNGAEIACKGRYNVSLDGSCTCRQHANAYGVLPAPADVPASLEGFTINVWRLPSVVQIRKQY